MERRALENDPQELDKFKQKIDLVEYAQRQGYQITAQGKRGDWQHLENNGEHLIVSRKDNKQVYLNPGDDRDRGTIIDFVKTREHKSLGEVRLHLREYLNEYPEPSPAYNIARNDHHLNSFSVKPIRQSGQAISDLETAEEQRTRLIAEVLGIRRELSDRSYLHSRALTDETIDNPAFKGRVFTSQQNEFHNTAFPLYNENGLTSVEQKNTGFKSLLALPKDGIWVSHPTLGKDTPIERLVVNESAVDAMSYHQLKYDGKNTMYIATAGTVTEKQIELIQRVIDKQQPSEIVLANDRDAAGRKFNINYLNDLHPARPFREVANQEAYAEAESPIGWHGTLGKYHTNLRIEYHHASAPEGAERVKLLVNQVARINSLQEEPSIELAIQRSTEKNTVLRLSVAKADTAQLEVISQELYRQREQLRPELQKQPANFIRVDYAIAKDFNRDLELITQGLNPDQIRHQAILDEQAKATQKQLREQQRAVAQQQELTHPAAGLHQVKLPPSGPAAGSEKQVLVKVEEPYKEKESKGQAETVKDALVRSGANVGDLKSSFKKGVKYTEIKVSYRTDQEEIGKISKTLDAVGAQRGNQVMEKNLDRAERREIANKPEIQRPAQQEISR
ncbi:toprim domain-containing protein [Adhaeribacter rhizoryzae]|uniref:Toprim domain-containing protein n=1 Tax=Adhaeribacter rhizoryzae TaxID=2607907 RepID=A0A5M6CWP3_9BACT|nr:toprim domain-containing protein [Adhaeribacter rhizoryzae]KAA5539641.1 hypothetical protein F0145_23940 [Adhaeribacter rhizoryzae]